MILVGEYNWLDTNVVVILVTTIGFLFKVSIDDHLVLILDIDVIFGKRGRADMFA